MQKVEDYIGVPIFDRTKNKLMLNDTGRELVKNAQYVIDAEMTMKEKTISFYNQMTNISIGSVAPGPMIKYGNLLYSLFPNKTIFSKIEKAENLIENVINYALQAGFSVLGLDFSPVKGPEGNIEYLMLISPNDDPAVSEGVNAAFVVDKSHKELQ